MTDELRADAEILLGIVGNIWEARYYIGDKFVASSKGANRETALARLFEHHISNPFFEHSLPPTILIRAPKDL